MLKGLKENFNQTRSLIFSKELYACVYKYVCSYI